MPFCCEVESKIEVKFTRYKITYECEKSIQTVGDGFKILKSKHKWQTGSGWTIAPNGKSDSTLYEQEDVLDYVQDFVFVPHDEKGKIITSSLPYAPDKSRAFDVRTVDVGLILRSTKEFYKKDKKASGVIRKIVSLTSGRDIAEEDKYLRDIITVTANARNVGLE